MLKRIIKTSFFSVGSRVFMTAATLALTYLVSHGLGEVKLGIFSLTFFFYYLFAFLTSFELTIYFGREAAHQRNSAAEMKKLVDDTASVFVMGLGISVILLVFLFLFYKQLDPAVLFISSISGIVFGLEKNLSGFLLGKEQMHVEFVVQALSFFIVVIPVWMAIKKIDIIGIYYLRILASMISILIRWIFSGMRGSFHIKNIRFRFHNPKEILLFAVTGLCYFVQYHIDLLILSFYVSVSHEGAYFLALRIFTALCLLPEMTTFALTPFISRVYRDQETAEKGEVLKFHDFYKKIIGSGVLLGLVSAAFLFFSRHFVSLIFTKENPQLVAHFLTFFAFLLFFRFVSYYTGIILSATQFQNVRFYTMIISSILMIVLGFIFAFFYHAQGILYARAVMEIFIFIAYFTYFFEKK
ncbi:MAG: lipopolysaccharide biosynthesis protein [Candidatus Omnitrophota bacterium]